ncbi:probable tyrosyl-DNA phosphodiesterase [Eriocheir sinensis]|uniref:probable tyrosyl-DNA phosphodiesterase n=1 Tax=Eriocheir sinensis TaxID=95602 RepID=UPI0021C65A95|nr:probable tyrosyl-DNA phosphodiesterase [Eriocheir sinensis]
METDEALARRLQQEFDAEARAAENRERKDALLAQKLAVGSHNLSDSEEEEEEEEEERKKTMNSTSTHQEDEEEEEEEEESRKKKSHASLQKEEGGRGRETNSEHMLSEEEEEEEEEEKEERGGTSEGKAKSSQAASPRPSPPHPATDTQKGRPVCQYGAACYRKNPAHRKEFAHPQGGGGGRGGGDFAVERRGEKEAERRKGEKREAERRKGEKREGERREEQPKKIQKSDHKDAINPRAPFRERVSASAPFRLFLNKCYSVPATQTDPLTLVLPDLLSADLGDLVESAQLNFMVDLEFLMGFYKAAKVDSKPLTVAYGQLGGDPSDYPALKCVKVPLPYQYGTHHTKAMLLLYKEGLRVAVHTANLVPDDWLEKTQGYWLSPLCPPLENGKSGVLEGDSDTRFKKDLVGYLQAYKLTELTRWAATVKKYDFSECNAVLLGSVPGYHAGGQRDSWGHTKLRRILAQHSAPPTPHKGQQHPIIVQCSSIGSLGKDQRSWLSAELGLSLAGHKTTSATVLPATLPKVCVVYPSQADVRDSSQGWMGGSCLPYNSGTHEKQPWLLQHLHSWRSECRGRTRAMPHIKTYTRVSADLQRAHYFLLSSANLSKAAWGVLQKDASQLFIRSYELGVLLLPKFVVSVVVVVVVVVVVMWSVQPRLVIVCWPPAATRCAPLPVCCVAATQHTAVSANNARQG